MAFSPEREFSEKRISARLRVPSTELVLKNHKEEEQQLEREQKISSEQGVWKMHSF